MATPPSDEALHQDPGATTLLYGPFPRQWWKVFLFLFALVPVALTYRFQASDTLASLECSRATGRCVVERGLIVAGTSDVSFDLRDLRSVQVVEGATSKALDVVRLTLSDRGQYDLTSARTARANEIARAIRGFVDDPSQETLHLGERGLAWYPYALNAILLILLSGWPLRRSLLARHATRVVVSHRLGVLQIERPRLLRAPETMVVALKNVARVVVCSGYMTQLVAVRTIEGERIPLVGTAMIANEQHHAFAKQLRLAIWGAVASRDAQWEGDA